MTRPTRALVALGFAAALIGRAAVARANPSLTIDGDALHEGDPAYAEIVVRAGGVLHVPPLALVDGGTSGGVLHLRAGRVRVEAGGRIDAIGSGFAAHDGGSGDGPGPGLAGPAPDTPGGGGAFGGNGDTGRDRTCAPTGGLGGSAYLATLPSSFGSAGGAAKTSTGGPSLGGPGGGRIVIEAALVEIDGAIDASGAPGVTAPNGIASGGGAGGSIEIRATTLRGSGAIVANGGAGRGTSQSNGGGGGGGTVIVVAATIDPKLAIHANAGATGACAIGAQDGPVSTTVKAGCLDVDGDGAPSATCGGTDCDDSDAEIRPGLPDVCDGKDNDCDGAIDAPLAKNACASDHVCEGGACRPKVPEPPAPIDARPDHLALEGGCRATNAPATAGGILVAAVLAALVARRRARR